MAPWLRLRSQCRGVGSIPGWGTKILHVTWPETHVVVDFMCQLDQTTSTHLVKHDAVADLIFLGSKIIADGDCSHEIKRHLLLGRKVMTNLDSILKSRHYFANKGRSS